MVVGLNYTGPNERKPRNEAWSLTNEKFWSMVGTSFDRDNDLTGFPWDITSPFSVVVSLEMLNMTEGQCYSFPDDDGLAPV